MQIGLITLVFQLTASVLQPIDRLYTDKHPHAVLAAVRHGLDLLGMLVLALAGGFATVLVAAALIGVGSSVFHPEASRVARLASGGRFGFAQSLFQVGGNAGQAIGPLLAALLVMPAARASVPGSRWRRCSASSCCRGSAAGTATHLARARGAAPRPSPASPLPRDA